MATEQQEIEGINYLKRVSSDYSEIDNCCIFVHIESPLHFGENDIDRVQRRISDHMLFLVLVSGSMSINYNSEHYNLAGPVILCIPDGTMLQIESVDTNNLDLYLLIYQKSFAQEVNISHSFLAGSALVDYDSPVISLKDNELSLMLRYFKLIHAVMSDTYNIRINGQIVANLTASLFYQLLLLMFKRVETNSQVCSGQRRSNYVRQFLKLVHLHYMRERSVAFYASQLFISPKYLSLLVKEATGRSAVRWIDSFVILEAKNQLRYSGKNIQQVAYSLNFSNQSSFGKYFKHMTGMSPSEYQKNS